MGSASGRTRGKTHLRKDKIVEGVCWAGGGSAATTALPAA